MGELYALLKMPSSNKKEPPAWMNKLFPIVFTIAGLLSIILGSQQVIDGFSSKNWKTAEGVITESRLADKGRSSRSRGRNYEPVVIYSYKVNDQVFRSDRILFGLASYSSPFKSGEQRSRAWINKYPVGAKVTVFFDPSDCSKSSLNTGAHFTAWIAPSIGLAFLSAALLMFKKTKKAEQGVPLSR